jgi:hypothetical protein
MQTKTTFGKDVLHWYFLDEPLAIVKAYVEYAKALLEIIPFGFLLLTLLSPWKNLHDRRQERGFNLNRAIESACFSLLSRGVGSTVRLITIALGLFFHIILLACSLLYLGLWISFPLWTVVILHATFVALS